MLRFPNFNAFFLMDGDTLQKTSNEAVWHTVRSSTVLPLFTVSEVSFKVVNSVHNSLIFGITTQAT